MSTFRLLPGLQTILILVLAHSGTAFAGSRASAAVPAIAEAELARRNAIVGKALEVIEQGKAKAGEGQVMEALALFKQAKKALPESPMTMGVRAEATEAFARTGTAEAHRLAGEARYIAARNLLGEVLAPEMAPDYGPAMNLLKMMGDADRYAPAASPKHARRVAMVDDSLRKGESAVQLGLYDDAIGFYDEALRVDPYNKAARSGQEKVERLAEEYFDVARNHTRASMLRKVDETWESPNPQQMFGKIEDIETAMGSKKEIEARNRALSLERKMKSLMLPAVRIDGMNLREAVEYLSIQSRVIDRNVAPGEKRGVDMVIQVGGEDDPQAQQILGKELSLNLDNVPLDVALHYVAQQAGVAVRVESFAVVVVPPSQADTALYTRSYAVPPDFIVSVPVDTAVGSGDPFEAALGTGQGLFLKRMTPKQFFEQSGVTFPGNAFVVFDPGSSILTMRNSSSNHELVEAMVERSRGQMTPQVTIEARMIEVSQQNLEELGFDWLLGAFNMGNGVFGAGGTGDLSSGGNSSLAVNDPLTGQPVGRNPVTAGNRSGDYAITGSSLEKLVDVVNPSDLGTGQSRAPAALSLAGVLTEPNFQVLIRAISQKKGSDFLTAPVVVTRSGMAARVEMIREFIYPTEYDPPQLPNSVGTGGTGGGQNSDIASFPVTPATPTAFEMRPVGTILDVEPVVAPDGSVVEVNLNVVHREFMGFVNYGTPITSPAIDGLGRPTQVVVTENKILQPIFETRDLKSNISVYDGQTLVVGGFIGETREDVEDKVPILGDMPLLGRFFKTKATERRRTVLMILLTVKTIDPGGTSMSEAIQNPLGQNP